jgi:colanic acid/amylovoran biosynthesis glycosyltransferase
MMQDRLTWKATAALASRADRWGEPAGALHQSGPAVAIFAEPLLAPSMTFIRAQASALRAFVPFYVSPQRCFPSLELPAGRSVVICENPGAPRSWNLLKQIPLKLFGYAPLFFRRVEQYGPALVHAHFGVTALTALPLARRLRVPMIATFHGYDATVTDEFLKASHYRARVYCKRRKTLQRETAQFVAASEFVRQQLLLQGFPEEKVLLHYIGVDTDFFRQSKEQGREPVVLFVARLTEKKACGHLVRAMEEVQRAVREIELVVIGDGPLRKGLEQQARCSLRKYRFLGIQPPEVVRDWMSRARVFCVPSIRASSGDAEGFGMVFAEAQAMGLPVASYASGGVPEAVKHGETGLLATEGDWRSLVNNILALLQNDDLWRRINAAGPRRVHTQFDLARQTRKLEVIYRQVLSQAESPANWTNVTRCDFECTNGRRNEKCTDH